MIDFHLIAKHLYSVWIVYYCHDNYICLGSGVYTVKINVITSIIYVMCTCNIRSLSKLWVANLHHWILAPHFGSTSAIVCVVTFATSLIELFCFASCFPTHTEVCEFQTSCSIGKLVTYCITLDSKEITIP